MIHYSVIIPQRDRADEVRRQLPALAESLAQLRAPFEVIVVDDGSTAANVRYLDKLLGLHSALRVLRLDQPAGASAALSAGIRSARGEIIVATEPGDAYPPAQIAALAGWLRRADLVVGRRRRFGGSKLRERLSRIPRWLLLGLDSHDPDCLFWAARREALADITLSAGMARYLPALVASRGFRVSEVYVEHHTAGQLLQDVRPNPADLLAAWWHCRRWRQQNTYELLPGGSAQTSLRVFAGDNPETLPPNVDEVATLKLPMPAIEGAPANRPVNWRQEKRA
ncbi:MAG TPA: glycosyltransferase [Pirellulales bacterium]|jgi:glycosyltransferase involved in cell wall biosynthesis